MTVFQIPDTTSKPRHRARASAFTLVELLAVIAIVAALSVAGASMMSQMNGANVRQRAAAQEVASLVDQARSRAIASGEDHFLVLANGDSNFSKEQQYRAMAIYRRSADKNKPHQQITAWDVLPQGAAFHNMSGNVGSLKFSIKNVFDLSPSSPEKFPVDGTDLTVPYMTFSGQGAVTYPGTQPNEQYGLVIFMGNYSGGKPVPTRMTEDGKPVLDVITISRFTGRVKHLSEV